MLFRNIIATTIIILTQDGQVLDLLSNCHTDMERAGARNWPTHHHYLSPRIPHGTRIMAMVGVVSGSLYSLSCLQGLVLGRRPLGAVLHSSNEPDELSQWLCHDDSTINIVLVIIIIIIMSQGLRKLRQKATKKLTVATD